MKKYSIIFSLLLLFSVNYSHAEDDGVKRVVYHADFADPRRFSAMLTSINNMVNYYTNEFEEYDIRIVFVASGIRFLTGDNLNETPFTRDKKLEERSANLKGRLSTLNNTLDVKLELCDITRSGIGLDKSKLYENLEIETVPSGVVRVAELQGQGFAYIKVE